MFEPGHFEKIESYIPVNLETPSGFALGFFVVLFFILARYFGLVSIFYVWFWKSSLRRGDALHDLQIKENQIWFEIKNSLVSSAVFAFCGVLLGLMWQRGWTQIYLEFGACPLWYLVLSFILVSVLHEMYFYFTHVWMHRPSIYRHLHQVHHHSRKTTPWASFSFHYGEALVQALFLPLVVLLVPIHPLVLIAYLTFMTVTAIFNHLGFEIIGNGFLNRHFISGTHHSLHHERFNGNFGLYFCFLDRVLKTEIGGQR